MAGMSEMPKRPAAFYIHWATLAAFIVAGVLSARAEIWKDSLSMRQVVIVIVLLTWAAVGWLTRKSARPGR